MIMPMLTPLPIAIYILEIAVFSIWPRRWDAGLRIAVALSLVLLTAIVTELLILND